MKKLSLLLAVLLLCGMLTSCNMGNGLIAELFGDPLMPETELPMIEETWIGETWIGETWIEVEYAIPGVAEMEYLSIYLLYPNGSVKELMNYEELRDWNGTVSVSYVPGTKLVIKAYAAYFYSDAVSYSSSFPDSECVKYDFSWSDLPEDHDPVQGDAVHSFYIEIPLDSLSVGHNQADLYAHATDVMIDGWVMMQTYDILLEADEGDMTEDGYLETEYPVPPETMPTEDTTEVPDIEETTEDVTYG